MSRVFVTGAGFSHAAGVPVLNGMLEAILDFGGQSYDEPQLSETWKVPRKPGATKAYLEMLLKTYSDFYGVSEKNRNRQPNLEEFFTFMDEFSEMQNLRGTFDLLWLVEQGPRPIILLLGEYLWSFTKRDKACPSIAAFASMLNKKDTVITFNWDNLLERALFRQGKRFQSLFDVSAVPDSKEGDERISQKEIRILKLHGSIDWRDAKVDEIQAYGHIALGTGWEITEGQCGPDGKRLKVTRVRMPLERGEFDKSSFHSLGDPELALPVFHKRFVDPYIREAWLAADRSLAFADEVIFIGYSLPQADRQARLLFQLSLKDRRRKKPPVVKVVNPDENVIQKLAGIFPNVQHAAKTLEEFVA